MFNVMPPKRTDDMLSTYKICCDLHKVKFVCPVFVNMKHHLNIRHMHIRKKQLKQLHTDTDLVLNELGFEMLFKIYVWPKRWCCQGGTGCTAADDLGVYNMTSTISGGA